MPSKIQLDENLWFLYICLQKSDYKAIDFNAVGEAASLKPPAARMRYTRLRRAIESGTLIGTHGTPFQGGHERTTEAQRKRKKTGLDGGVKEEKAPVDDDELGVMCTRSGSRIGRAIKTEAEYVECNDSEEETPNEARTVFVCRPPLAHASRVGGYYNDDATSNTLAG
ncbi:MAG: hypothetical protein M1826_000411 [Phylliscum demangeonii]|nr:MAG: hypothetical protein M1826_000411 [Phylliscum demangeonii]